MNQEQSDKKNFLFPELSDYQKLSIEGYSELFSTRFIVYRRDNTFTAINYLKGLIISEKGKANMERMEEEIPESEYRVYQHFISNSKWDYQGLIMDVARGTSDLLEQYKQRKGFPTGYIVDESAHLKKGKESVGVSNQYAGVAGKVENCQVGVYSSLVNDNRATLINAKLFLPKSWTNDQSRCKKAGIPEESRTYKTKPELALEMIDEDQKNGVKFDWIGGDGLYGHSFELTGGLEKRGLFYVLDIHKDELIFLSEPGFSIPEKKQGRGRKPIRLQADIPSTRVDEYLKTLKADQWEKVKVRKTAKGWLKLKVHIIQVWVWDKQEKETRKRILIITKTEDKKPQIKYSYSNGGVNEYTTKEYAYFQAQRYWVERTFDDAKNELGLSDYQIRKWIGWYHHNSLVMMASLFLMRDKIVHEQEYPLMSVRDARIMMIVTLFGTKKQQKERIKQMKERHRKRQADIDRHYRYQDLDKYY